jgi:hypothetical protein
MKKILFFLTALVVLAGCSNSQFVSVRSDAPVESTGQYYFENDTVKINYSFKGNNGPVNIHVFNKLPIPLYLDWTRSAVIINQQSISMWKDESNLSAQTETSGYNAGYNFNASSSETNGVIVRPETVSFIPPQSSVSDSRITLRSNFFDVTTATHVKKSKRKIYSPNGSVNANLYEFQRENSPFTFKTYLTLSTEKNGSHAMHVENEFWVSEILQSDLLGKSYMYPDNGFRITKPTPAAAVVAGTALVGVLVLYTYAGAKATE